MSVKKYRKKPVIIEAIEFVGDNSVEICEWSNNKVWGIGIKVDGKPTVQCETLEGDMFGSKGDFIIKGVNGEFYPCKPDIFEKTYEIVK